MAGVHSISVTRLDVSERTDLLQDMLHVPAYSIEERLSHVHRVEAQESRSTQTSSDGQRVE